MFALVQNSQVVSVVHVIPVSSEYFPSISNLDRLDAPTLLQLGWFPLEMVNSIYDPSTQVLGIPLYEFLVDKVVQTFTVVNLDPTVILQTAKDAKTSAISEWYAATSSMGFLSPTLGYLIPSSHIFLSVLQNKYDYMVGNSLDSFFIIAFDGSAKVIPSAQTMIVFNELSSYLDYIDRNNLVLIDLLAASTTIEQINAITVAMGAYTPPIPTLAASKTSAVLQVKGLRGMTLSLFQKKSPGVVAVYADNVGAAIKLAAGDTEVMPTGQSPLDYLTIMGANLGMTGAQFGAYIISENIRLTAPNQTPPSAYDVECKYISSSVGISMAATVDAVNTIVSNYRVYVSTVTGN